MRTLSRSIRPAWALGLGLALSAAAALAAEAGSVLWSPGPETRAVAPAPNLLDGDTSLATGFGPFEVVCSSRLGERPQWSPGQLCLPSPGPRDLAGAALVLPATPALVPGEVYTCCFRARGEGQPVIEVSARDGYGRGSQGRFQLGAGWQDYQLTWQAVAMPGNEEEARQQRLDWSRRRQVPDEVPPAPHYQLRVGTLSHGGAPGRVWLTQVRLLAGSRSAPAVAPALAVDAVWNAAGPDTPAWLERSPAAVLRVAGRGEVAVAWTLSDTGGAVVRRGAARLRAEETAPVPLAQLPAGFYTLAMHATAGDGTAQQVRRFALLHDRRLAPLPTESPLTLDDGALAEWPAAAALGYRQIRLHWTWAALADAQGQPSFEPLDRALAEVPVDATLVNLVVSLTPASALPPGVVTARRMDSHAAAKGVPLGDVDRFERWAMALATHLAGRRVLYELDAEPHRWWNAVDYAEYLRRFRGAVQAADAQARLAGGGVTVEAAGGGRLTAFDDACDKHGVLELLDSRTLHWPGALGEAPEDLLGLGLGPLAEVVAETTEGEGTPAWRIAPRAVRPVGPLDMHSTRLVAPAQAAAEVSPYQSAARLVRELLWSLRLRPAAVPTGWRGGWGPREAALDNWLSRYGQARFVRWRSLADGVWCVLLEQPDGTGLGAVWDARDERWTPTEASEAPAPELRLGGIGGVTLRSRTLYGRERREDYQAGGVVVPLSFEPVFVEAPSPLWLDERLAGAVVRQRETVRVEPRVVVRDGRPAVGVALLNLSGEATSGWLRLLGGTPGEQRRPYRLAAEQADELLLSCGECRPGTPVALRLLTESGRAMDDRALSVWPWTTGRRPLPVIDGSADDWGDDAPVMTLGTAAQRSDPTVPWQGADDLSASWRARYRDGAVAVYAEVTDRRLTADNYEPRRAGSGVEVTVSLEPRQPFSPAAAAVVERLLLAPLSEGRFAGRHRVARTPGQGSATVLDAGVRSRFLRTATGYRVEALLPLTPEARERIERDGGFGFDFAVQAGAPGRCVRLAAFTAGPGDLRRTPARVCLGGTASATAAVALTGTVADGPPVARVTFDPQAGNERFRLTPEGFAGALAWLAPTDGLARCDYALRADLQGLTGPVARLLAVALPERCAGGRVRCWARTRAGADAVEAPRLALLGTRRGAWLKPTGRWRRYTLDLPAPMGDRLTVVADGRGVIELAEVSFEPPPASAR